MPVKPLSTNSWVRADSGLQAISMMSIWGCTAPISSRIGPIRAVVSIAAFANLLANEGFTVFSVMLNISSISDSIRPKWPQVFLSSFGTSVLFEFFVVLVVIGLIVEDFRVEVKVEGWQETILPSAASSCCGHLSAKMAISADFGFPRIRS